MPNRGIYGSAGLYKRYLKTIFFKDKIRFFSKDLRRLLSNALIQSHFDYACAALYPNLRNIKRNWRLYKKKVYTFLLTDGQHRAHQN